MVLIFYQLCAIKVQSTHWVYGSSVAWTGWLTALNNFCVRLCKVYIMYRKIVALHFKDSGRYTVYGGFVLEGQVCHVTSRNELFLLAKHNYTRASAVAMGRLPFALAPYYAAACEHAKFNLICR